MINGVINVRKEAGYTSSDVVARLRGIVHQKKIGHTGTLDPDAVGVLPVCLGRATKLVEHLTDERKTYETVLLLGTVTDTEDTSGTILSEKNVTCTEEEAAEAALSFIGEQMQVPPMYSALKKDGKRLYELAREGKVVEREARPVTFYDIEILKVDLPRMTIRVTCSRGTYIRTLCHDIGEKLGCGGCMEHLTRTRVGRFCLEEARTLDEIKTLTDEGRLLEILTAPDDMFRELPKAVLKEEKNFLAWNGNRLLPENFEILPEEIAKGEALSEETAERETAKGETAKGETVQGEPTKGETAQGEPAKGVRVYDSTGAFVALYKTDEKHGDLKPETFFYDPEDALRSSLKQ